MCNEDISDQSVRFLLLVLHMYEHIMTAKMFKMPNIKIKRKNDQLLLFLSKRSLG